MRRRIGPAALALLAAAAAGAETIELANGDEIECRVVEETDQKVVIQHEVLGRIELRRDQLASQETPGLFGTSFLRGWERTLQLGVNGQDGNSETLKVNGGLRLFHESDYDRWLIEGGYNLSRDEGETSSNNAFAQLVKDWLHPDRRWFPYAETRWDYDQFQAWDHRLSAGAGIGYSLFESERFELLGRLGAGASRTFGSDDDEITPELLLGLEGTWHVSERQRLSFYTKLYPDLGETGEYRNLSGAAWIVDVSRRDGLALKLGVDNRYESRALDDRKKNDLKYYGALLYDF